MSRYIVAGQINVEKSNIITGDFLRYLHSLQTSYRLNEYGVVKGMEAYSIMSHEVRSKQLFGLKKNAAKHEARVKKGRVQPYNVHTYQGNNAKQKRLVQLAREKTPNNNVIFDHPSLWNMDLDRALMPFPGCELPQELLPSAEQADIVTIASSARRSGQ